MIGTAPVLSRKTSDLLEAAPSLYRAAMIFKHRNRPFLRRIVSPEHDLVIEAFPRSASSFASQAFMFSNGWRDPRVATHTHSAAQIVLAAGWKRPMLVPIREPRQAVVSLMGLAEQTGEIDRAKVSEATIVRAVAYQTARYARFHERILPLREAYVLSTFEETTRHFDAVIGRLNKRFGTDFDLFDPSEDNMKRIFGASRVHLSPSAERDDLKARYDEMYMSEGNRRARERADRAYARMLQSIGA